MNPFTRYLSQWSSDPDFAEFVAFWDRLERVVIEVYRAKRTAADAAPDYRAVWPWLRDHYSHWEPDLGHYWPQTRAAGEPTAVDPFRLLLDIADPSAIPGDWRAMQHLPAARESINRYLVEREANGG